MSHSAELNGLPLKIVAGELRLIDLGIVADMCGLDVRTDKLEVEKKMPIAAACCLTYTLYGHFHQLAD